MNRDEILEHLQPAIDALVERITSLVPELVRVQLFGAIDKLTGEVDEKPKRPRKVVHRDPKPAKKAASSRPVCSKCEQPGHNARSCGREPKGRPHGPKKPIASAPDVVAKPPPSTAERIASPRSKRPQLHAVPPEPTAPSDVPLHKVVAFTF